MIDNIVNNIIFYYLNNFILIFSNCFRFWKNLPNAWDCVWEDWHFSKMFVLKLKYPFKNLCYQNNKTKKPIINNSPSFVLGVMVPSDWLIFKYFRNLDETTQVYTLSIGNYYFLFQYARIADIAGFIGDVLFWRLRLHEFWNK